MSPGRKGISGYRGVHWNKYNKKWAVSIWINGKNTHLGYFKDKEEARDVYNAKEKEVYGDLTYFRVLQRKKPRNNTSGYKGVYAVPYSWKYQARIIINNTHIYLGLFNTKEEAHAAYCEAGLKYCTEQLNL